MKKQGSYGPFLPNNNVKNKDLEKGLMDENLFENIVLRCDAMKIIFVYPKTSEDDDLIKKEIRSILLSALLEQMAS